jgi:hypothetical protein
VVGHTCSCGFGDDLSVFRVVDDEDVSDDHEEQRAVSVKGAGIDDVGVRRLWLWLG